MSMNAAATIAPPAAKFRVNKAEFDTYEEASAEANRAYVKYGIILGIEEVY